MMDSLASSLASLPERKKRAILTSLSKEERERLEFLWSFWARPKQLAPIGAWRTWLICAGRAFGKTRSGAEWVRGEVEAGRCGRLALVGATAADARDVIVEGESGLLSVCPPWNRPVYEPSKRRLTWPNGAIATTYSADEPDRLRGPQHDGGWADELACLPAGTLVECEHGPRPIERVRAGERVWTRSGLRRVARAEITSPSAPLFLLETDGGHRLIATANHPVFVVGRGFVSLSRVPAGAQVIAWRTSCGADVAGIRTRATATSAIGRVSFSIARYGRTRTARFLLGRRSIIETKIAPTTISRISNASRRRSTSEGTSRAVGANGQAVNARPQRRRLGALGLRARGPARVAERDFGAPRTARTSARPPRGGGPASTTSFVPAARAAALSSSTATTRPPIARVRVARVEPLERSAPVYNLGVEGVHEYFASGLLVHNCWRYPEAWDQLQFGLRLGTDPRLVVTTTPRPTPIVRALVASATTHVTRGSTYENRANLPEVFFEKIIARYEGTRLGRQELLAEVLDDNPGAIFQQHDIERGRVRKHPPLCRIVVAIDPAVSKTEDSDETGIVVVGLGVDGHGYVLDDLSGKYSPSEWAKCAIRAFNIAEADRIVAEVNQGGDLVIANLRAVDPRIPVKGVRASRGKRTRAEPIASLYEQTRVHHVGVFAQLEDQMVAWDPGLSPHDSPDRMDALVWGLSELMLEPQLSRRNFDNLPPG